MTDQLFTYAGYSVTANGQTKARFGNDMVSRVKKLSGTNSDVWFEELPKAMTKKEASEFLLENEKFNSDFDIKNALLKVVFRNTPKGSTKVVNKGVSLNDGGE
jgi:hypothetical protein